VSACCKPATLDLRQDIERNWKPVIETFRHRFTEGSKGVSPSGSALEVPDFEGLQLVGDDELSERIVVREFAAQLAETCDGELYPLDRRIAALLGHEEPVEGENPLSPMHLCQALADASAGLGLDAESRLLLMRRIERHLHQALPAHYHAINLELIERRHPARPQARLPAQRPGPLQALWSPGAAAGNNAIASALQSAADTLPAATDLLGAMQRLLAARGQPWNLATAATSATPVVCRE
jgi:hypothetical protein